MEKVVPRRESEELSTKLMGPQIIEVSSTIPAQLHKVVHTSPKEQPQVERPTYQNHEKATNQDIKSPFIIQNPEKERSLEI